MPKEGFDFAGYATRNNVRCSDGTIIRPGCFHEMDGKTVPLVYQHNHNSIGQVLGHCEMEERPDGMYCYAYCNDSEGGQMAKEAVAHGDINAFSIWANNLKRNANDILHGTIREVSLVLSGADRTALIDTVVAHGEESPDEAEIQFLGGYADMMTDDEYFAHADDEDEIDEEETPKKKKKPVKSVEPEEEDEDEDSDDEEDDDDETVQDVLNTFSKKQRDVLNYIVGKALQEGKKGGSVAHADTEEEDEDKDEDEDSDDEETIQDVLNTFSKKQRDVLNFIVGKAIEDTKKGSSNKSEEDEEMKHNAFDEYGDGASRRDYISHEQLAELMRNSKNYGGSLKEAFRDAEDQGYISHDATAGTDYGIENIDYLFPDARAINPKPDFISRNMDWVDGVLSAVHRTPFSRVKSIHANITEDEARARGYIKGKVKKEEVFSLIKRSTYPQTIYKKQKLDKDDIDDITDFSVVEWLKAEMQLMLREEIARAILIGDGRLTSDDDHIKEENVRPVFNDADLYDVKVAVEVPANATDDEKAKALIKAVLKSRKLYKGTGNPVLYTTEDDLTNMLLLENGIGERLYKSEAEVATAMRVARAQTVTPMEGLQIEISSEDGSTKTKYDVAGILVNLADYNVGTNGGAKTDFFDDFDIDVNQYKYLYETRLSGALVTPYSAMTYYFKPATTSTTTSG